MEFLWIITWKAIGDSANSDSMMTTAIIFERVCDRRFFRLSLIRMSSIVMAAIIAAVAMREPAATHVVTLIKEATVQYAAYLGLVAVSDLYRDMTDINPAIGDNVIPLSKTPLNP